MSSVFQDFYERIMNFIWNLLQIYVKDNNINKYHGDIPKKQYYKYKSEKLVKQYCLRKKS